MSGNSFDDLVRCSFELYFDMQVTVAPACFSVLALYMIRGLQDSLQFLNYHT